MHPQEGETVGAKWQTAGSLPYSSNKGAQVTRAAHWPSSVHAWKVGGVRIPIKLWEELFHPNNICIILILQIYHATNWIVSSPRCGKQTTMHPVRHTRRISSNEGVGWCVLRPGEFQSVSECVLRTRTGESHNVCGWVLCFKTRGLQAVGGELLRCRIARSQTVSRQHMRCRTRVLPAVGEKICAAEELGMSSSCAADTEDIKLWTGESCTGWS